MDELVTSHIMMICVYRPEREHKCYRLRTQAQRKCFERYTEIQLQKLTDRQGRQLVQSLLTMDNLTSNFREMILSKSEGNPFVIEEIIRSLMDRGIVYREGDRWKVHEGISEIDVPDTIHSVIMSRIDRLEAETKYVLLKAGSKAGIHALCPQSPASSTRFEYLKLYRLMNNEK